MNNTNTSELFSRANTNMIKGVLALCVLIHHLYQRVPIFSDAPFADFFMKSLGACCVSGFLFVSGYGITSQYKQRVDYLSHFQVNRVLPIVFLNMVLVLVYSIEKLCLGIPINAKEVVLSLTYGGNVVDNGWYLLCIVLFYELFYFCAKFFHSHLSLTLFIAITVYVVICKLLGLKIWWYASSFAFPIGCYFAENKQRIEHILAKYRVLSLLLFLVLYISCFVCLVLVVDPSMMVERFRLMLMLVQGVFFFLALLLLLSPIIKERSSVLRWASNVYLDIYILQGFVFNLLRNPKYSITSDLLFSISAILLIVCTSFISHPLINRFMAVPKKK